MIGRLFRRIFSRRALPASIEWRTADPTAPATQQPPPSPPPAVATAVVAPPERTVDDGRANDRRAEDRRAGERRTGDRRDLEREPTRGAPDPSLIQRLIGAERSAASPPPIAVPEPSTPWSPADPAAPEPSIAQKLVAGHAVEFPKAASQPPPPPPPPPAAADLTVRFPPEEAPEPAISLRSAIDSLEPTLPGTVRLVLEDGTVEEVPMDPEVTERARYLAENLIRREPPHD